MLYVTLRSIWFRGTLIRCEQQTERLCVCACAFLEQRSSQLVGVLPCLCVCLSDLGVLLAFLTKLMGCVMMLCGMTRGAAFWL